MIIITTIIIIIIIIRRLVNTREDAIEGFTFFIGIYI